MVPAFLGLNGRSLSSHLAALVAAVMCRDGAHVTVLRAVGKSERDPSEIDRTGGSVSFVEVPARRHAWCPEIDARLSEELRSGSEVVLDLSGEALGDPSLAGRPDVLRVAPIDATGVGLGRLARESGRETTGSVRPPVVLACGWGGGEGAGHRVPPMPRSAFEGIARGRPGIGALSVGEGILAALERSFEGGAPPDRPQTETLVARLWGLAADLDRFACGDMPTEAELDRCPTLEGWRPVVAAQAALAGRTFGHPLVDDGRHSVTSCLFHTDGRTYARTMSRLYRLGAPAGAAGHG